MIVLQFYGLVLAIISALTEVEIPAVFAVWQVCVSVIVLRRACILPRFSRRPFRADAEVLAVSGDASFLVKCHSGK